MSNIFSLHKCLDWGKG